MRKAWTVLAIVVVAILAPRAHAQKATEIYIPLGESPGVSGKTSVIGTIESVDTAARTMTVRSESGQHRIELTVDTKIWLDNSPQRRKNERGSPADCIAGRRCEVRFVYENGTRTARAEWIKIRPGG